ncbi:MAG: iron ABC transporter permease [Chloracidobacterium sp.]|uniref:Iron ABC transporter permease n=1 Tax=Chloracidobacterium validum TaxID=2821543 RepID=A0ABX8B9J0_9BACT|nr:iron ABC transporter permease [Chloracidobacterium validum]QUW03543.1 iron ABC transporter permease [Chloracidobacterium validum]
MTGVTTLTTSASAHRLTRGWLIGGLAGTLALVVLFASGIGAVAITPMQSLAILAEWLGVDLGVPFSEQQKAVLLTIRLPRVLFGVLVGAGLALAGAVMQGVFRNPLADPGIIGVSSGAALAAVLCIRANGWLFGKSGGWLAVYQLPIAAFLGGSLATFVVYRLARREGTLSVGLLLLAGIALAMLTEALRGALIFAATDDQLRSVTFWSLGSLGGASWSHLAVVALLVLPAMVWLGRLARPLDALLLGESEARHLGFDVTTVTRTAMVAATLIVGAAVAFAGVIGFVGLVAPHLIRLAAGPGHRTLLPASALLGAGLVVLADLLARTVVSPAEMPLGVVTASLGAPCFLWLLLRERGFRS